MKIVGVCCSAQKKKTTWYALNACLEAITEAFPQISTVSIELAEKEVNVCKALNHCTKKLTCGQKDDFKGLIPILSDPDLGGIIVATPVYMGAMSGQCKAFLDRCVMFRRRAKSLTADHTPMEGFPAMCFGRLSAKSTNALSRSQ